MIPTKIDRGFILGYGVMQKEKKIPIKINKLYAKMTNYLYTKQVTVNLQINIIMK